MEAEPKNKELESKLCTKVYKNTETYCYRVFLNFPRWVGMKVYELEIQSGKIKCTFLKECTYQGESKNVSDLYSEVTLFRMDIWREVGQIEIFEKCINCEDKACLDCKNLLEYYSISIK
jgi:hypothetical protein